MTVFSGAALVEGYNEVWCLIERERQRELAAEVARLNRQLGLQACGVVAGEADECLAQELGKYGIAKLYWIETTSADSLSAEDYAYLVTCLIKKSPPYICLFAASTLGNEVAARVSVRLGTGLVTWCTDLLFISGKLIATKKGYDGKASKRMFWQCSPPYLATVDPEVMEAITSDKACLPVVEKARLSLPQSKVRLIKRARLGWREIPLTEAVAVLGVGGGVKDKAGMRLIEGLAESLDMSIGGTKRADELGLATRESRIGASGVYIDADVYIAIGISGAPHHVVGIKKVKHVVAINQDKAAPIFDIAELGIVNDFHQVVTALTDQAKPDR